MTAADGSAWDENVASGAALRQQQQLIVYAECNMITFPTW